MTTTASENDSRALSMEAAVQGKFFDSKLQRRWAQRLIIAGRVSGLSEEQIAVGLDYAEEHQDERAARRFMGVSETDDAIHDVMRAKFSVTDGCEVWEEEADSVNDLAEILRGRSREEAGFDHDMPGCDIVFDIWDHAHENLLRTVTVTYPDLPDGGSHEMRGDLHDYRTGEYIRAATSDECRASIEAAKQDNGRGVFSVDGRSCYVIES